LSEMTALGLLLVVAGVVAVAVEAHRPSHGALGTSGALALACGAALALDDSGAGALAAILVGVVIALSAAMVVASTVRKGVAVRRRAIRSGREGMLGRIGVVSRWEDGQGVVLVDGALWRARLEEPGSGEEQSLRAGEEIVVEYVSGLTLKVRRAESWELMR
jgi:membrane-bound serine protease (ClpP class)